MALIIGDMRSVIKVMSFTTTRDEYGADIDTYTELMSIRAAVKFLSGTKTIDNKEIFAAQSLQFSTHYRGTITEAMRIDYDGKKYRILSIAEIGFKEGLLINCELINE